VYRTGFSGYSTVYVRFYVQIDALPASGQSVKVAKATTTGSIAIWELYFMRSSGGTLQIRLKSSVPDVANQYYDYDYSADIWYCFEVKYYQHSTDGEYRVWLNGVEILSRTGVDTSSREFGRLEVGVQWSNYAVTTYHDCVVISETYIGQEPAARASILGDINLDGFVNILDLSIVARAYDCHPGDEAWNPDADLNNDEAINIIDLSIVAQYFGESTQPPPPFKDDFSGDLSRWEIIDGNWYIEDGKLRCDVISGREKIVFNEDVGDNYEITCKVYIISYVSGPEGQIITRYEDSNNFYFMGLGAYGYKGAIGTYNSGTASMLVSGGNSGYVDVQTGVWYEQKVVVVENTLTVFIDGEEICSITDTSHLTGRVGLTCIYSSVYFDDFTVKKLSPSPVEPPQNGMIVGVDVWCGTTSSKFLAYLPLMQECGIQMVRLEFSRDSVANLRTLVPTVVNNGIKVLGLLIRTDLAPNNVDSWGDWVYSVVSEFKQYIKVWEIWNEPNQDKFFSGKDPVKYTNFLKRAYTEAKRADPNCFVLGGSVVFTHNTALNFLRTIYDNGGGDYMDALSYHPYCSPYAPDDTSSTPNPYIYLTRVRDVMTEYGEQDKKIWITELGWAAGEIGEQTQADYLVQALQMARDWGWVETSIIYNWKDSKSTGTATKGLLRTNLSPKASFYAVENFIIE
jgi:hypothetical protein